MRVLRRPGKPCSRAAFTVRSSRMKEATLKSVLIWFVLLFSVCSVIGWGAITAVILSIPDKTQEGIPDGTRQRVELLESVLKSYQLTIAAAFGFLGPILAILLRSLFGSGPVLDSPDGSGKSSSLEEKLTRALANVELGKKNTRVAVKLLGQRAGVSCCIWFACCFITASALQGVASEIAFHNNALIAQRDMEAEVDLPKSLIGIELPLLHTLIMSVCAAVVPAMHYSRYRERYGRHERSRSSDAVWRIVGLGILLPGILSLTMLAPEQIVAMLRNQTLQNSPSIVGGRINFFLYAMVTRIALFPAISAITCFGIRRSLNRIQKSN